MAAEKAFVVSVLGSEADFDWLRQSGAAMAEGFVIEHADTDSIAKRAPDVAVIGAGVEKPLPLATQIRIASPQSQILFLMPGERLHRFRASLPFVPNLGSAWSTSTGDDPASLGRVLLEAAKASRQRAANAAVLGRINQRLATGLSAPAEARRSQLALTERYLATILTQSPDGFVAVDPAGSVIAFNDAASDFFGADLEGGNLLHAQLVPEEQRAMLQDKIRRAADGEELFHVEIQLGTSDGEERDAELSIAPVHTHGDRIDSVSITARDITERTRAAKRQRMLISELNHRVKNTLAIVQALAQQSFKPGRSSEEQKSAFTMRLSALAAAHDLLTQKAWHSASIGELIRSTLHACGAEEERIDAAGPEVVVAPQTAVSLAIAFHELCTNAIKYGALSAPGGLVRIRWATSSSGEEGRLQIEWIETGGPPVEAPTRKGFGLRMLERGLASELGGTVSLNFSSGGLVCRIDSPLPVIDH